VIALSILLFLFVGFCIVDVGVLLGKLPPIGRWEGISWSNTQGAEPSVDAAWLGVTLTSVAAMITIYNLMREIVYLRSAGRYWIGISREGLSLASPLGISRYSWEQVSPFVVRALPLRGWTILRITARTSRFGWFCLRSDDFSTGLDSSRRDAANKLVRVLNELLGQVGCGHQQTISIPQGLRVAPIDSELRQTSSSAPAVARR
jgi:hypothetical protein